MSDQNIVLTAEALQQMVTTAVVTAVQELKKPTEEEAQKAAAERERKLQIQQESAKAQTEQAARDKAVQDYCPHMKGPAYPGQSAVIGQIHSDGLYHPICMQCSKEFLPFAPTKDTLPHGNTLGSDECRRIPPTIIVRWGENYAKQAVS